jgi:transposase
VLKLWARRHRELSRQRNRLACQLHAVLCDLIPGGFAEEITGGQAAIVVDKIEPRGSAGAARLELARDLLAGIRGVDEHRRQVTKRLAELVAASKTTVTDVYGVGPVVAATVLGYVSDVRRCCERRSVLAEDVERLSGGLRRAFQGEQHAAEGMVDLALVCGGQH